MFDSKVGETAVMIVLVVRDVVFERLSSQQARLLVVSS